MSRELLDEENYARGFSPPGTAEHQQQQSLFSKNQMELLKSSMKMRSKNKDTKQISSVNPPPQSPGHASTASVKDTSSKGVSVSSNMQHEAFRESMSTLSNPL